MYDYEEYVCKYAGNYKGVRIPEDMMRKIEAHALERVNAKLKEQHHKIDSGNELKRQITGLMGEAALEILLGIPIIDWTIGDSTNYNNPDIPGYRVGIKTVEKWKYPVILKKNYYPQIICVRKQLPDTEKTGYVFVCGLATPEVLNQYQDDELILSDALRQRGVKTGFYKFEYLKPVRTLADLEPYRIPGNNSK